MNRLFCLLFPLPQFLQQSGKNGAVIRHHAVMTHAEDGRAVRIIDAHAAVRLIHTGHILSGTGNAHVQNEVRFDRDAALADLSVVGHPTVFAQRAGTAQLSAQKFCQLMQQILERLRNEGIYMVSVIYGCAELQKYYEELGFTTMLCGQMELRPERN